MPKFPKVSDSSRGLSSKIFSELAKAAREKQDYVHPLHVGDTYREPIMAARAESQLTAERPHLHTYAPVQGVPELVSAIHLRLKERTGVDVPERNIQVMSGATSGISVVCETILNPGDEVLLPSPYWPLVRGIIASRGAVPVQVPFFHRLSEQDLDIEAMLEAKVTDRTVALYINSPHNPTGAILSSEQLNAMVRVAKRHDLWVLCDEAYQDIWFTKEAPQATWTHPELADRYIACHTLSKSYGLAGSRIGYTHGPDAVMSAIRSVQTFQTYCAAQPMQYGAARALREGNDWLREGRQLYGQAAALTAHALKVPVPEGGTFVLFDASPYLSPEDDTALPFLKRCLSAGVLLTPGGACGEDFKKWVRLCFTSTDLKELEVALRAMQPLLT